MDEASDAAAPTNQPEPAGDRRWLGRDTSPTLTELLRLPPSGPVEVGPDASIDDDADDGLGVAHGLAIDVLTWASKWGAIGLMVWLLLDW